MCSNNNRNIFTQRLIKLLNYSIPLSLFATASFTVAERPSTVHIDWLVFVFSSLFTSLLQH